MVNLHTRQKLTSLMMLDGGGHHPSTRPSASTNLPTSSYTAVPQSPKETQRHAHSDTLAQRLHVQLRHGAVESQRGPVADDPHLVLRKQR